MDRHMPTFDNKTKASMERWRHEMQAWHTDIHTAVTAALNKERTPPALAWALTLAVQPFNSGEFVQLCAEADDDDDDVEVSHSQGGDGYILVRRGEMWTLKSSPEDSQSTTQSPESHHAQLAWTLMRMVYWGDPGYVHAMIEGAMEEMEKSLKATFPGVSVLDRTDRASILEWEKTMLTMQASLHSAVKNALDTQATGSDLEETIETLLAPYHEQLSYGERLSVTDRSDNDDDEFGLASKTSDALQQKVYFSGRGRFLNVTYTGDEWVFEPMFGWDLADEDKTANVPIGHDALATAILDLLQLACPEWLTAMAHMLLDDLEVT